MPQAKRNRINQWMLSALAVAGLMWSILFASQVAAQSEAGESEPSQRVTQKRDSSGTELPSRTTEARSQDGNRKSKVQVVESPGLDGRYQPLLEREEETIQVDSQTTRVVVKEFGRNADGSRSLLRQTEAETRTLSGGRERTTRNISRPDVNGRMQAVEREVEESRETGPDTRETSKTLLQRDMNGSFQEVERVHQVEQSKEGGSSEVTTSTARPDANGRWGTAEVRKQSVEKSSDGAEQTDEQVFRNDINDRQSLTERKITRTRKDASGQEQQVEETYSKANRGASVAEGDRLPLAERKSSIITTRADGSQQVEQRVERTDPTNPSFGVRVTGQSTGTVRKDASGKQSQQTISIQDGNGGLKDTVVVDIGEKK